MKKYESLTKRYKDQDPRTVFAYFPYNQTIGENWETHYEKLAKMAKTEEWNFKRSEFILKYENQNYPILSNYLNYTFLRVQELDLIVYSEDGDKACFNTGLMTQRGKDIFATFFKNKQAESRDQYDWTFYSFVDSYS